MMRETKTAEILCPLCAAREAAPLFTKGGRTFSRCGRCRLIFQEFPASFDSNSEFYEKNYYESFGDQARVIQTARLPIYDDFLRESAAYRRTGRLLDVGSGYGDFLKKAESAGWESWGIEPSRTAAQASRDFLGARALNQTVEATDFPADYFDVITLWNVIDCLPDPVKNLKKIQTWLRPGGLLLIRTPNASFHLGIFRFYNRFQSLLEKIGWKKEASVFLRSNFNAESLKALLEKCGFSHIQVQNGRPTQGDAYGVFSGSLFMQTAKSLLHLISCLIEFLTGGRVFTGSNLIVRASKGSPGSADPNPAIQKRILVKRFLLRFLAAFGYLLGLPLWFKLLGKDREIRILRYHSVNEYRRSDVNVRESEFRRQIDFLSSCYKVVPLDQAVELLEKRNLPERGVVALTFDDGYQDNYDVVYPLLQQKGMPGAIFLLAGGEGQDRALPHLQDDQPEYNHLLNWEEARQMADSGITLGSHGQGHARLALLPRERAEFEIVDSKKKIESEIKRPVQFFSYPYGTSLDFDKKTEALVKEAGYRAAFSAIFGANDLRSPRFALRRIGIEASDTLFTFRAKLNGALAFLSFFDLPWVREIIRWLDGIFLGKKGASPMLLVSVDFPPHTDGISTISKELSERIARRDKAILVIGPADRGAREFDKRQPYRVFRAPGYDWGYGRFLPLSLWTFWVVFRFRIRKILAPSIAYGGVLAWLLSYLIPLDYLVFAHGYEFEKVRKTALLKRLYQAIYRRACSIVTNSHRVRERLIDFGVAGDRIKVLHPAVNTLVYHPAEAPESFLEEKGLKGRKILLTVGRLIERKGHDQMIRALPRIAETFPDVLYAIVGIGDQEKNLRDEVGRLRLENHVRFFGKISEEELVLFYNACDIFVMPSREIPEKGHLEGFGIVYLEANACAKPVIGGKSGGVGEAVRDGETGFLVDPNSPAEISEKVIYLFSHPGKAEEMGLAGLKRVREAFDWDRYTEEVLRLL